VLTALCSLHCSGVGNEGGDFGEDGAAAGIEPGAQPETVGELSQAATGGCSPMQTWGEAGGQACVNSPGPSLVTADAYVRAGGCTTCKFRFVLQLKEDIPGGQDPVVDETIGGYRNARLAIEKARVTKNRNYYSFLRLEQKVGNFWIRVHTIESPRVTVR
jgi:hypothetical protein